MPDDLAVALVWDDDVATVSIAVPERGNALSQRVCDELIATLDSCSVGAAAIVLTGQGSIFSAGGDLDVISEWHTWSLDRRSRYVEKGPQAVIKWFLEAPVVTVCAVNGAAFGAGLDLALACDLRIASTEATFCEAFIRIEVVPGDGAAWLLPRYIGIGRALDMLLTGRVVASDEALSIGLVSRVVPANELAASARELARTASGHDRSVVHRMRSMVFDAMAETFEEHLAVASRAIAHAAGEAAHVESVARLIDRNRNG